MQILYKNHANWQLFKYGVFGLVNGAKSLYLSLKSVCIHKKMEILQIKVSDEVSRSLYFGFFGLPKKPKVL